MDARRAVALGIAIAAVSLAGCGKPELPSREKPTYQSPGGEVRFWAPDSWSRKTHWGRRSWRIEYHAGAEAAARQRHAIAWMLAEFVPERTEESHEPLFRLTIYTTAGYESLAAEPGIPAGTPIGAAAGRVAVAWVTKANPYSPRSFAGQEFDAMRMSIDTLRSAVRLAGAERGTTAAWGSDTLTYSIRLPAVDAPGREVRARFAPDGSATWTTTYAGKGWPMVEKARWEIRNGDLTLSFGEVGSGGPAGPLEFAIADSALVPIRWPADPWGAAGAPLLVYRPR